MYHVEHCKHSQKSADRPYNSAQVSFNYRLWSENSNARCADMPIRFHLRAESIFRAFYRTGEYRFANEKRMKMRQSDPLKKAL
jgi:hypothetical protein